MKNVTINKKRYGVNGETPVRLNNGSIVLHFNKLGDVLGAYIVTSFRDSKGTYRGDSTTSYCSFVDLDTGYLKFDERCSRNTTIQRVISHLNSGDYAGQQSIKEGQYIEVYAPGEYTIDITTNKEVK